MGAQEEKLHELWEAVRHIANFVECDGVEIQKLGDELRQEGWGDWTDPANLLLLSLGKVALRQMRRVDPDYQPE